MARHWVLVGLMGSGKSSVGSLLAARAGREFVDNDEQLLALTGRTAAELQSERGWDELHRLEREALEAALRRERPAVIGAAASVVDDPDARARLRQRAVVIWLDVGPVELARRVRSQSHRPLADDPLPQLQAQRRQRESELREVADIVITSTDPPDEIVDELLARLDEI